MVDISDSRTFPSMGPKWNTFLSAYAGILDDSTRALQIGRGDKGCSPQARDAAKAGKIVCRRCLIWWP
jgi:hypothetical protein